MVWGWTEVGAGGRAAVDGGLLGQHWLEGQPAEFRECVVCQELMIVGCGDRFGKMVPADVKRLSELDT